MSVLDPTTDGTAPSTADRSRRDVLCGLVVALLAPGALAAACSDGDTAGGGSTTTTGAGGGTPTGGGGTTGGGAQALAAVADVPDGGGLVVDDPGGGKLLLVRSGSEVRCYNASCTHQGTTVNPPEGGTITCPNHGSQFDAATGDVKKGPAEQALAVVPVKVDGTNIVTT